MKNLKLVRRGAVAEVSLHRPDVRNAFQPEMIDELTALFRDQLNVDGGLRAVVLKGEGDSFCAGADLAWMQSMVNYSLEENTRDSTRLFEMFFAMRACPVPLLGRVHGHVMGGALGLLAVCDIGAAEKQTLFSFSEARLGLAPAVISTFVLEKAPAPFAHRYMLSAEVFSAAEAAAAGLVHFVGDLAAADAFVAAKVDAICANGPEAVRATKALLRSVVAPRDWSALKTETCKVIAERRVSAEGQEGLRGFLGKRPPAWKGS